MSYRIQNFRKVDHQTVKASFDLDFGAIMVRGFNLIATSSGGHFLSPPSERYTDKNGQERFKDIAVFADDLVKAQVYADIKTLYAATPDQTQQNQPAGRPASPSLADDDIPF